MRKTFLFIFGVLSVVVTVYAQPAQEPALATSATVMSASYHMGLLQLDKDTQMFPKAFLASVNGKAARTEINRDSPANKMGVGAMNAATAWTEIPKQMGETSAKHNPLIGATVGLGEGIVKGMIRGASGVADIATFGLPPYDKPLMQPAYEVKQPEKGFKVNVLSW